MAAGWQAFFDGLPEFLRNADRQFGIANQQYTEYVIERLQKFSRKVCILKEFLFGALPSHPRVATATWKARGTKNKYTKNSH